VDVWDALLNKRPYREAWTKAKVIRYLRKQAGTHFDPNILEVFLKMMEEKSSRQPVHGRKKTPPKRNTIKGGKNSRTKKKA
jgi:HD-GYP domain-containing protein (c-di-GMP phosphodiesterase class II)